MSRQRVLDLESEFHFLFSRSKASDANIGIVGILSHFGKKTLMGAVGKRVVGILLENTSLLQCSLTVLTYMYAFRL